MQGDAEGRWTGLERRFGTLWAKLVSPPAKCGVLRTLVTALFLRLLNLRSAA